MIRVQFVGHEFIAQDFWDMAIVVALSIPRQLLPGECHVLNEVPKLDAVGTRIDRRRLGVGHLMPLLKAVP